MVDSLIFRVVILMDDATVFMSFMCLRKLQA